MHVVVGQRLSHRGRCARRRLCPPSRSTPHAGLRLTSQEECCNKHERHGTSFSNGLHHLESTSVFAPDFCRSGSENYGRRVTPPAYSGTLADFGGMLPPLAHLAVRAFKNETQGRSTIEGCSPYSVKKVRKAASERRQLAPARLPRK